MKKKLATMLAMLLMLGSTSQVFAADAASTDTGDYAAELKILKERVSQLETKMQQSAKPKTPKQSSALEKLQVGGDFRIRSVWNGGPAGFDERVRLALTDKVNDNTTFYVRWAVMKDNAMGTTSKNNDSMIPNADDDNLSATDNNLVSDAYLKIDDLFGTKNSVTMGRFGQTVGATGFWNSAGTLGLIDGIKFETKINDLTATVGFADWSPLTGSVSVKTNSKTGIITTPVNRKLQNAMFLNTAYKASPATTLYWTYLKETSSGDSEKDWQVSGPGIRTRISDDWSFRGDYLRNYAAAGNPLGEYFTLRYKEADDRKPHSWGLSLDYHYIQPNSVVTTAATGQSMQPSTNIKGPGITAHYSPAKDCMIDFYQTFGTKKASTGEDMNNYSRLQVVYSF